MLSSLKLFIPLILMLINWSHHVYGVKPSVEGSTGLNEVSKIIMKPLSYDFKDSQKGYKGNRLNKKHQRKGDLYRYVKNEGDNELNEDGSSLSSSSEGSSSQSGVPEIIKIGKGLHQSHKERKLDHVDHDSQSGADKFVKMVWDKGDGFVKRWHWDRGEKIKEAHAVEAKKHLEHHDKAAGDEHLERQQGAIAHLVKNQESSQSNQINDLVRNSDGLRSKKKKSFGRKVRLNLFGRNEQGKNGLIPIVEDVGDAVDEDNGDDEQSNVKIGLLDADDEDNVKAKARRFPDKKSVLNEKLKNFQVANTGRNADSEDSDTEEEDDDDNDTDKNEKPQGRIAKHRDYHRRVTVREEKSELASQERYGAGKKRQNDDKNGDADSADNGNDDNEDNENGYETGSKGSGYIKQYQLLTNNRKSLGPFDFSSIIGDQSKQIKTKVSKEEEPNKNENKSDYKQQFGMRDENLQQHYQRSDQQHQPSVLHIITPR